MRRLFVEVFLLSAVVIEAWLPYCSVRSRRHIRQNLVADGKDARIEDVVTDSLRRLVPIERDREVNWKMLHSVLREIVYRPHAEDWSVTRESAAKLSAVLPRVDSPEFRCIFDRVLEDGGWDRAEKQVKPWVVLVAGLNGIRKTTSLYAPWFQTVLAEALEIDRSTQQLLPWGGNSFFRQLDYIIATIANLEFEALYRSGADINKYAKMKAEIFAKYRTAAELVGLVLLEAKRGANVMVETSGRDAGLFGFVDLLFTDEEYNKLVLYFDVDNIEHAKRSVADRMDREMKLGMTAVDVFTDLVSISEDNDKSTLFARAVVDANCGGPYGPEVLDAVQTDSRRVWQNDVIHSKSVAASWQKAVIRIHADADNALWTAEAAPPPEGWLLQSPASPTSVHAFGAAAP